MTERGKLERVTLNLTPASQRALEDLQLVTGESKTDCVNKALRFYDEVLKIVENGGGLYARSTPQAELERLRFI